MAKNVITTVELTDDIDGSAAVETVQFTYDGIAREIDLSKKNKTALDKALKPYVDAARKVSTRASRTNGVSRPRRTSSTDVAAVRNWATAQGIKVSSRGRIAASTLEAYRAAH